MEEKKSIFRSKTAKVVISGLLVVCLIVGGIFWAKNSSTPSISEGEGGLISIGNGSTPLGDGIEYAVTYTDADYNVIPDKYNCGTQGSLKTVKPGDTIDGVTFRSSGTAIALEFCYSNKSVEGVVVFDSLDFSGYDFVCLNEAKVERNIQVIFWNCKFASFRNDATANNMSYVFNNCEFSCFGGSSAEFNRCLFGRSYKDGMNPCQHVKVNDCYFCDLTSSKDSNGVGVHSDGVQIYGSSNAVATDIEFNRCRFEIPAVQSSTPAAEVNACLMVQLEFNNADGIHFTDCYINGGGYSIYAWDKNLGLELNNVTFENIAVGCSKIFGTLYPKMASTVRLSNVYDQNSLYVGSVWKDESGLHFSVTNDTNETRTLMVYADGKEYYYQISACPNGSTLKTTYDIPFSSFPFDIDITVSSAENYAVCYDVTNGLNKQLRCVMFSNVEIPYPFADNSENEVNDNLGNIRTEDSMAPVEETAPVEVTPVVEETAPVEVTPVVEETAPVEVTPVVEETAPVEEVVEPVEEPEPIDPNTILYSGDCGQNVRYTLNAGGTLTISGNGAMNNYHSGKPAPWMQYADIITNVEIEVGVSYIGNQAFRKLSNIETVVVPSSVSQIGANSFIDCKKLTSITIPESVTSIGSYALSGTSLNTVYYLGSKASWDAVSVGNNTGTLSKCNIEYAVVEILPQVVISGSCGPKAYYELTDDGCLRIYGEGSTNNYHSRLSAPWYDYASEITSIVVEEGITVLGTQVFRKAVMLENVSLPGTLTTISANAFIDCKNLKEITIPRSVKLIGQYAFSGTSLQKTVYMGSRTEWRRIDIRSNNGKLTKNVQYLNNK